ncbi:MAG: NAD(P)-dependent oxidoreductase [Bacillota bacterium]
MIKKVGFFGCGAMGKGMIKNLLKAGYEIIAYDVSEDAVKQAVESGATAGMDPAVIASNVDAVISSLPSPVIVKELMLGDNGIIANLKSNFILDMSTIDPGTVKEIYSVAKEKGIGFLDCPVSGGPGGADAGTLAIMVGGDERVYEEAKPLLNAMGRNIFYIGESGTAQVVKLCHNMIVAANALALGEAFLTGSKAGLQPRVMAEVISKSVGRSGVLEVFGPKILNGDYENPVFMLKHMYKDMDLFIKFAAAVNMPTFLGGLVHAFYRSAMLQDKGNHDHTVVCKVLEQLSAGNLPSK